MSWSIIADFNVAHPWGSESEFHIGSVIEDEVVLASSPPKDTGLGVLPPRGGGLVEVELFISI